MSKLIDEQLKKIKIADLSNYDPDTNTYKILKYEATNYVVDKYYVVELDDVLLIKDGLPILVNNWNNNKIPTTKYLLINVTKKLGKMIYIVGAEYNLATEDTTNVSWEGWLPTENIKCLKKY